MENKQYSSQIVKDLLTNEVWSFWKSDWSKRIVVYWNPKVKRKNFFAGVEKLVGNSFIYERALSGQVKYRATNKGLIKI